MSTFQLRIKNKQRLLINIPIKKIPTHEDAQDSNGSWKDELKTSRSRRTLQDQWHLEQHDSRKDRRSEPQAPINKTI